MSESEWLASEDPSEMLAYLTGEYVRGGFGADPHQPVSDRKLRLFACACFRVNAAGIEEQLELASRCESWADGGPALLHPGGHHTRFILYDPPARAAASMAGAGRPLYSAILRDIIGNPFRPVAFSMFEGAVWHAPDDIRAEVYSLARAAYGERGRKCETCRDKGDVRKSEIYSSRWDREECGTCHGTGTIDDGSLDNARLAVLSDALEEAGCDNADLLMHLRGECVEGMGPCDYHPCAATHYRGCWAVDLLLGKS